MACCPVPGNKVLDWVLGRASNISGGNDNTNNDNTNDIHYLTACVIIRVILADVTAKL